MVPPVKPVNRKLQGVLVVFVGLLIYPMTAAVAEMFKRAIESVENQNFDAFLTYAVIAGIFAVGELVLGFLSTWMTFKYTQQLSMDAQTRHLERLFDLDEETVTFRHEQDLMQRLLYDSISSLWGNLV